MRRKILRAALLALCGTIWLAAAAAADTLELKDGRLIQGKFVGGSEFNIRFLVNGKEEIFPVKDILNLSFNSAVAGSATDSSSAAPARAASHERSVTVPAGTEVLVRMIDGVDSATNHVGDTFRASLEDALVAGDTVVAPKGADVYARLVSVQSAGQIQGRSELRLELTGIRVNGKVQPVVSGEYNLAGKSRGAQSAKRIGGGAALGAIIGAIAGGGKGAAIGAGVGAGAGTAVQIMTHGEQVRIPSETLLTFRLQQPLAVMLPR